MSSYLIETAFPSLTPSNYRITSPESPDYNCIAWAAGTDDRWWWPDNQYTAYWPDGAPREETFEAFIQAYSLEGYIPCDTPDYESGFEKIAIYTDERGKPTHAAKQTQTGRWTSKLGRYEDIEHDKLDDLSGSNYGAVTVIMKRPNPYLGESKPRTVWDFGANTGVFSRLASDKGIPTISFDVDPAAVEKNYLECKKKSETYLFPLLLDLTNSKPHRSGGQMKNVFF